MNRLYMFTDFENLKLKDLKSHISCMPPERIEKFNNLSMPQDKLNCVVAYFLLFFALKECCLSAPMLPISFLYGKNQKPRIKTLPNLHFNISHTHKAVVCAISSNEIGVDIEKIRPINLKISSRICTKSEQKLIENSCNKEKMLLEIWTKKESYAKMLGSSVFENFLQIDTSSLPGTLCFERDGFIISLSLSGAKIDFFEPTQVLAREILDLL